MTSSLIWSRATSPGFSLNLQALLFEQQGQTTLNFSQLPEGSWPFYVSALILVLLRLLRTPSPCSLRNTYSLFQSSHGTSVNPFLTLIFTAFTSCFALRLCPIDAFIVSVLFICRSHLVFGGLMGGQGHNLLTFLYSQSLQ